MYSAGILIMQKQYPAVPAIVAVIIVIAFLTIIVPAGMPRSGNSAVPATTPLPPLPKEPLLLAERLNSTDLLLREPVGGFRGPLLWINGPDNITMDYVFYSRNFGPGNVTLTVYEVENPLNTTPVTPSSGISARIIPDHFIAGPGTETVSQLVVNISPAGYSHDPATRTFFVHAEAEREKNAVADDWIRVRMGDQPITYLSYQTSGDFSEHSMNLRRGDTWKGTVTVSPGERGTGPVHVWFKEIDCTTMEMGSYDVPQPWDPGRPVISVSPDQFTGRSFGRYELSVTITAATDVPPGKYCYGVYYDTADGHTSYPVNVQVVS
jgi:hypothetical protein